MYDRVMLLFLYKYSIISFKFCTYNFRNEIKKPPEMPGDDGRVSDYVPYEDTLALTKWRQAIGAATSSSQLAVCVNQLERCIAWEKSPMKVVCTCTCIGLLVCIRQNSEENYYSQIHLMEILLIFTNNVNMSTWNVHVQ